METKAYVEGILRRWWLLGSILALSFLIASTIINNQTSQYTASVTILINGPLLAQSAVPSNVVQIETPLAYESQITSLDMLDIVSKHYPRLNALTLEKLIVVSTDASNQLLTITFTDISPAGAADIVNYLAQQFVHREIANLKQQIDYYENWLQKTIPSLTQQINALNLEIQNLPATITTGNGRTIRRTIVLDQYQLNVDEASLYNYQEALKDLQATRPLFAKAFVVIQPATVSEVILTSSLSPFFIYLIALALGLLIGVSLSIALDYFTPFVRHKGELKRIVGIPVLAELPRISRSDQKRLLRSSPLLFRWRMKALRQQCASIGALAIRGKGPTILLTSPRKKRNFAAILATLLACNGHKTLLIDADFQKPHLHRQIGLTDPCEIVTDTGRPLSFIWKTSHPKLLVLPATAMIAPHDSLTSTSLTVLLPELQAVFDIIIIDAQPLNHANTHILATKAAQTILLVKKRRDSIKVLKTATNQCTGLKLDVQGLLLT